MRPLTAITDPIPSATAARKCHSCGCSCEPSTLAAPRLPMNRRVAVLGAVTLAIAGVVAAKQLVHPASGPAPVAVTTPPTVRTAATGPTVLLFADLREGDESCGCGQIIRDVRGIEGRKGITVRELDARTSAPDQATYGVKVLPAVLILGADGRETTRFEGEDDDIVTMLEAALAPLGT